MEKRNDWMVPWAKQCTKLKMKNAVVRRLSVIRAYYYHSLLVRDSSPQQEIRNPYHSPNFGFKGSDKAGGHVEC
jgi:hypothetical protein